MIEIEISVILFHIVCIKPCVLVEKSDLKRKHFMGVNTLKSKPALICKVVNAKILLR